MQSHINKSFGYEKYDMQAINDMMERDKYLSADEAKEHGIVDEILHRREKGDDKSGTGEGKGVKP